MVNIPDKEYQNLQSRLKELEAAVAECKQAEEAQHESERKYRELVENANSIILRWTRDGRITFLNEFGQSFFGYSANEILGRHVIGTIVPETESGGRDLKPLMDEILKNPAAFEQNINENMRRNGEHVWIAWTNKIVLDPQGNISELLSIGQDITERKRAEEELKKRMGELEIFYKSAMDREDRILELKKKVEELEGRLGEA